MEGVQRVLFEAGRFATAVGIGALLVGCSSSWEPAEREGPAGLVQSEGEPRLWFTIKREEHRYVLPRGMTNVLTDMTWENRYHFEIEAHDTKSTQRLWQRSMLQLLDDEGGHTAPFRILGQDGDVVWLFMHDQPVAVSSKDGNLLADRAALEQRNPTLQGLFPSELKFYAFDDGLVVIAADARRFRLKAPDYTATPYPVDNEERFRQLQFMSTTWNGAFHTKDFTVRQAMIDGRWLGLHSEKEARDIGTDEFGRYFSGAYEPPDEGASARRTIWSAKVGKTRAFPEGSHDRLTDVAKVPGAPEFLAGGFLVKAGTRQPLALDGPPGVIVLHKTRIDAEGRLAVTRLDRELHQTWSASLPFLELHSRWEWPDRLLALGAVQETYNGATQWREYLVALDVHDGATRVWNLHTEDLATPLEAAH